MKLRLPFRHHELFYYNKKLFIHYFLVPGRQVPFLVRGGCSHPRPYRAIAYEEDYNFQLRFGKREFCKLLLYKWQ